MSKRGGFPGGGMPGNMSNLMKQAQRMQRQMEEQQKELEATVSGNGDLKALKISPEAVDPEDVEMLQDMIVAAVNEAAKQAQEAGASIMNHMTGGLGGMF